MKQTYGLERIGLMNPKVVYRNMSPAWLTEQALLNGEGVLSDTGALVVRTASATSGTRHPTTRKTLLPCSK